MTAVTDVMGDLARNLTGFSIIMPLFLVLR